MVSKKSTTVKKYQTGGSVSAPNPNMEKLRGTVTKFNSLNSSPKPKSGVPYKTGTASPVQNTMRKGGKATMKKTRKCC